MSTAEAQDRRIPSAPWLLFGALGGALAWAGQLAILDMTDELGCTGGWPRASSYGSTTAVTTTIVVVTIVAALLTAAAWFAAFRRWRSFRNGGDDPAVDRTALLTISGLLANALFLVLILLTGIAPLFFVGTCVRQ
jgi:hypothetical protein